MASPAYVSASDLSAQESFQSHYDLDNPLDAMNSYARTMHLHTQRQLELATRSSSRRGESSSTSPISLTSERTTDSVSSRESL